ncbi:unnamed protein product [Rhizophagus irregularis]|nr:unnamed protein product [Rhizophagus irregularis]CAB4434577.1 unnamed protein product [Rhizophagus irregularis]
MNICSRFHIYDQRSTSYIFQYISFFVMNICARFHIYYQRGIRPEWYLETVILPIILCHEHLLAFSQSDQRTML